MGACNFTTAANGKSAADAFKNAVERALYMDGHGGYTGTISEKSSFKVVQLPNDVSADDRAKFLEWIDREMEENFYDKWGPAGAVKVGVTGDYEQWVFFGYASY